MSKPIGQLLRATVPIAISFAVFSLSIWTKSNGPVTPLPQDVEWIAFMLLAILVPIYTIQVTIQLSTNSEIQGIAEDLKKAISQNKVVYIGNANKSATSVLTRLNTATEVLNTYLTSENPYSTKVAEMIEDGIRDFVSRKDTRYEETCSELGRARVTRIKAKLGGILPTSFQVRVVRNSFAGVPACNFIILTRDSTDPVPEEVFFGWGYFRGNANESVFWSNDHELIGFFRGYHKALRSQEVSADYS